jgi:putative membrane protein (TIGR04086 family)
VINIIKYIKGYLYAFISIIVLLFIITCLYYFNLINSSIFNFLKLFIVLISLFISNFYVGYISLKKEYIKSCIFSLLIVLILLLLSIITGNFRYRVFIYYFIIISISSLSYLFGIRKRKKSSIS